MLVNEVHLGIYMDCLFTIQGWQFRVDSDPKPYATSSVECTYTHIQARPCLLLLMHRRRRSRPRAPCVASADLPLLVSGLCNPTGTRRRARDVTCIYDGMTLLISDIASQDSSLHRAASRPPTNPVAPRPTWGPHSACNHSDTWCAHHSYTARPVHCAICPRWR